MMKILLVFLVSSTLYAQNLDSLYIVLLNSHDGKENGFSTSRVVNSSEGKCRFGLLATIKEHFVEFNQEQQNTIAEIMARPELTQSIISPSGLFKIHYDESGIHQPSYSVYDLAVAFDSAYSYEVNYLGYPAPPSDGNLGGDDKFDVYILNLGGGLYGATTPETTIGGGRYISYIEIDNSFNKIEGYNTFGIDAARVTAAHEFHHAIQLGAYVFRSEDTYYYELTSTAFEEFVFDEVNDYYAYMSSYFRSTNKKLEDNSGYNLAVWNIFLQERFNDIDPMLGHKIVKRSWEELINKRAILALRDAIKFETDTEFSDLFNEFGDWLHFTGNRAKDGSYFEEAANYPLVRSNYTMDLENSKIISFVSEPTSINYLTFFDYSSGFADTIVAVISNSNAEGSLTNSNQQNVNFTFSNSIFENSEPINDSYFYKVETDRYDFIQSSYIINNELSDVVLVRSEIDFAYPQPFKYDYGIMNIPCFPDPSARAELIIFSSDMNLVYSGSERINPNGNTVVEWSGLDNSGEKLGTGVYVFVTKANGKIKKGKFVILN